VSLIRAFGQSFCVCVVWVCNAVSVSSSTLYSCLLSPNDLFFFSFCRCRSALLKTNLTVYLNVGLHIMHRGWKIDHICTIDVYSVGCRVIKQFV
jgi:hypothetical protein